MNKISAFYVTGSLQAWLAIWLLVLPFASSEYQWSCGGRFLNVHMPVHIPGATLGTSRNTERANNFTNIIDISLANTKRILLRQIAESQSHQVIRCNRRQLHAMSRNYTHCTNGVKHRIRCFNLSLSGFCEEYNYFFNDCTQIIVGGCFPQDVMREIGRDQLNNLRYHMERLRTRPELYHTCRNILSMQIPEEVDYIEYEDEGIFPLQTLDLDGI